MLFKAPDGSDIIFNQDYFGNHRGTATIPGPFVNEEAAKAALWKK